LLDLVRKSGIYQAEYLDERLRELNSLSGDPIQSAAVLVQHGVLTRFQAKLLLTGRYKGFRLGPYVIREQIGQGGMGAVYQAEHETLRRRVAIKVLTPPKDDTQGKLTVERFLREARAAAALDHPNIVRIHDIARQGEVHYLVMEYVDGQTLDQLIEKGGPVTPSRAVGYIAQAAAGLQHAHEKGFVHRDIKPANLILSKDGTVKILDMGLARSFTTEGDKLTEVMDQGAILGTADFIAPEQAMNCPQIDVRADIYSLGATFFALVTGRPPFSGNTTQKLMQHQMKEAPDLTTVDKTFPPGLAQVVAKMLHKKPEKRHQTPAEVIAALAPWLSEDGGTKLMAGLSGTDLAGTGELQNAITEIVGGTKRVGTRRLSRQRYQQNKWLWAGVGAMVLLAACITGYALIGGRPVGPPEPQFASGSAVIPTNTVPESKHKSSTTPTRPVAATLRPVPVNSVFFQSDFSKLKTGRKEVRSRSYYGSEIGKVTISDGWYINHYQDTASAEYLIEDIADARALGIRFLGGTAGAQVGCRADSLFNQIGVGETVTFRLTYLFEGSEPAVAGIQKNIEPYTRHVSMELPPTDGQWRQVEFGFTRPDADPLAFIANLGDHPREGTLWLRALEVLTGAPEQVVFDLDLSGQKPFVMQVSAPLDPSGGPRKLVIHSQQGPGKMPLNWYRWIESPDARAEIFADLESGRPALGIRMVSGSGGVLLTSPEFAVLTGRSRLTITYQTGPASRGGILRFRPTKGEKKVAWDLMPLPPTEGEWRTQTIETEIQGATAGLLELYTASHSIDGSLRVSGITIVSLTPTDKYPPPNYHVDFSGLRPDSEEVRKKTKNESKLNSQELPTGWMINHFNKESDADYLIAEAGGINALGLRYVGGPHAAQVMCHTNDVFEELRPGELVTFRIKYQVSGGRPARAAIQLNKEPWTKTDAIDLEPTDGKWKIAELKFTRPNTNPYCLIFASPREAEGVLWIQSVDAWIGSAVPNSTSPSLKKLGPAVFSADMSMLQPGRYLYENRQADGENFFPAGFFGHCWQPESVAEFRCADVAGSRAFGFTNFNDTLSSQVLVQLEESLGVRLSPGSEYLVRVEYRSANDAEGKLIAREPGPTYKGIAETPLTRGGNNWKTAEFTFRRPTDRPIELCFENTAVGEGNTLWVRKIEIYEMK
jgi:tRNA A-37 threonylcarbamoyl transferase component Bud32